MPTLLVTGGCGFIGSHLVRMLLQRHPATRIINLDLLTYAGNPDNVRDIAGDRRYEFVQGDIADRQLVRSLAARGIDGIINVAAESHVDRSIQDSGPFIRSNVLGTQVLLDAAREYKTPRYLQVSTDEVYGSLGSTGFFTEATPLAPSSPYAASKAAADLLVGAYGHTFGIPTLITRCSNNYGPNQYPEKLIPLFIARLLRDEPVPVYGDGKNVRDWIHVEDHCAALLAVWEKGRPGEVYNIGARSEKSNLDITHLLLKLLGKPAALIRYVEDRLGHDRRYAIDPSKIESELGWRPVRSFDEGLAQTVRWYQQTQNR